MPRLDDGSYKKKKAKLGFKSDRRQNFLDRIKGIKPGKKKEDEDKVKRTKAVAFDEEERKEYLLGMHKRKNERRVEAIVDRKKKHRKETSKLRKELREEARQQFNQASKVPILPNYQFEFPKNQEVEADEAEFEQEQMVQHDVGADDQSTVTVSVQSLRAASQGRGKSQSLFAQSQGRGGKDDLSNQSKSKSLALSMMSPHQLQRAGSITQKILEDETLPLEVQQRLLRVKKDNKGDAQPKLVVKPVVELKKMHRIMKHSRKGHGKKAKSGKRKNR